MPQDGDAPIWSPVKRNNQDRHQYQHVNALGGNIVLTDDNQNVLVRYEYDVFGAIRSEVGTSDNPRNFTGKEFDADSNLYYFAARTRTPDHYETFELLYKGEQ